MMPVTSPWHRKFETGAVLVFPGLENRNPGYRKYFTGEEEAKAGISAMPLLENLLLLMVGHSHAIVFNTDDAHSEQFPGQGGGSGTVSSRAAQHFL